MKLKVNVYSIDGKVKKKIDLPEIFKTEPREDIIRKAFRATSLSKRQPYGSYPLAGMRRVGHNAGPGHGIARLPRTSGSSVAVLLANFRGGKSAHSPRTDKVLFKGINRKERKIAIASALSLAAVKEKVKDRGHRFNEELTFPVVVEDSIETIKKTKDARAFLEAVGLIEDVERAKEGTKIRAGRGKMRGRRKRVPKSLLVVGSSAQNLRPFSSLPGVDVASKNSLSLMKLAPGGVAGRLTVFTESALKQLGGGK
ncbi:50S ribosomal protein L4 [Thermoplasmatales archaeon AK]|nr:50S ribosomal protein L4 [Thermoplasmatales archaeon AK]